MSSWDNDANRKKKGKKRKVVPSAVTEQDREALRQNYTFLPEDTPQPTWQQRMVAQYHEHLYKDFVLANMTRVQQKQLGLRWRTAAEVRAGRGERTCGNLHCAGVEESHQTTTALPATHQQQLIDYLNSPCPLTDREKKIRLEKLPHGMHLADFEVPFTYKEQGERKTELVRLRLCLRCTPLLFQSKGDKRPYLAACRARLKHQIDEKEEDDAEVGPGSESLQVLEKRRKGDE